MNRRQLLQAGVAGLLMLPAMRVLAQPYNTSPGLSASPSGTVLVELANFYCNRCRAVNDHFERLQRATRDVGHDLRFAPVSWKGQSIWPDRVYYATRDLYPETEGLVRNAMFDGIQREGMAFESLSQVIAYLERRQTTERGLSLNRDFNLAAIAERANQDETMLSVGKAGRLVEMSGAEEVPVFAWVRDGQVIKVISPRDTAEPIGLVQLVYRELTSGSAQPAS